MLFLLLLISYQLDAQQEADWWYFGNYAGLNFSSGHPEPVTDGVLRNYEGCASISDSTGNLLFYTNGATVWTRNHQIMENGTLLYGDSSSTQSAIIIPNPDSSGIYYLITTDTLAKISDPQKGLRYSTVDLSLNNGNGSIIKKNILLLDSTLEKVMAVKHSNNKDYWLIAHDFGNSDFYTWLVDHNGISAVPIISSTGHIYTEDLNARGYMRINPQGSTLAVAILFAYKFELFNFDNSTGTLSYLFDINFGNTVYACEFSPDGSKLYLISINKLYQVDMNAGTPEDIENSLTEIYSSDHFFGAAQTAIDGKIYIASDTSEYLSVIDHPNELPEFCGFQYNALYLDGRQSRLGLPNFISSLFLPPVITVNNLCFRDTTLFSFHGIDMPDSVKWNFGDPVTGPLNESDAFSPSHVFSGIGSFYITLTTWTTGVEKKYTRTITTVALPDPTLGIDTVVCGMDSLTLYAKGWHLNYLWNNMSTDSALTVYADGTYSVLVENTYTGCRNSDTIAVVFSDLPVVDLGNDTLFCENASYLLDAFHESYSYLWQDQSTEPVFWASQPGTYSVTVENELACTNSDTIELGMVYIPFFDFPADTILCENRVLDLVFDFDSTLYTWQDGSHDHEYYITEPGVYSLTVQNNCGARTDSIRVNYQWCGDIVIPNVFTPNGDDVNNLFIIKGIEHQNWSLGIYNRWGSEVIFFDTYENNWNGDDQNGRKLSDGVYYYRLTNGVLQKAYHGTVRIMR
jgi:gliding motility-associated-like protein